LRTIKGFKKVEIIERQANLGLAESIISGVTEVVNRYGKIIVLEDDLIYSPYFLRYMNEALEMYKDDEQVISIHGYVYPVKQKLPETFFIRGADCWGWGTWQRGWKLFEADGKKLLKELIDKKLASRFDLDRLYPFTQMLKMQVVKLNNSWAIRWYASAFLANKLTLYPGKSLVGHIGFDNSGTHNGFTDIMSTEVYDRPIALEKIALNELEENRRLFISHFKSPKVWLIVRLIYFRNELKSFIRNLK